MAKSKKKISIFNKLRNYFFAGIVVLVPIGFTLYLTIFLISVSSNIIPKEINPNNYLPFSIPGLEILLSVIFAVHPITHIVFIQQFLIIFVFVDFQTVFCCYQAVQF